VTGFSLANPKLHGERDQARQTLERPARKDEKQPRPFPDWSRQRVEAVIWTLKASSASNATAAASPQGAVLARSGPNR
jgi:hypothetical protein